MAYIDLERQSQPEQRPNEIIVSSNATQSSGLYEWEQKALIPENIATGSLNLGSTGDIITQDGYFYSGDMYQTGSFGTKRVMTMNPSGYMTGSLKVWGDLVIEGSQSVQNVTTFAVEDPIIDLNFTGSTALASTDAGMRVGRDGASNAKLIFDHSETRWALDNADGSNINIVGATTTDTMTNKTITGLATSTMASAANLTFSGDGEVLGLPTTPSANDAATSKIWVQNFTSYLRKQFVKKAVSYSGSANFGDFVGHNTASFAATSASAPSGFSTTNEEDFIFFLNGQYMEHDALTVRQSGSLFQVLVDTDSIGYVLESDDEILSWGKFDA
jgi:hypothetical protein